jgi:predicted nicotinamide N-methyase
MNANTHIVFEDLYRERVEAKIIIDAIKKLPGWPNLESQEFVSSVIINDMNPYYPPPTWVSFIVKNLVTDIELSSAELSDTFAELAVEMSAYNSQNQNGYVSYSTSDNNRRVVLHIEKVCNEVGLKVWPAAVFMSAVFNNAQDICASKNVLELGSGTGCLAFIIAMNNLPPASVIVTDHDDTVLLNMRNNFILNETKFNSVDVTISKCDWNCYLDASYNSPLNGDIIIAADCVYSEDTAYALLATLQYMLLQEDCNNHIHKYDFNCLDNSLKDESLIFEASRLAFIGLTIRNSDTYNYFLSLLQNYDTLEYLDVTNWATTIYFQQHKYFLTIDNIRNIRIFLLKKKIIKI